MNSYRTYGARTFGKNAPGTIASIHPSARSGDRVHVEKWKTRVPAPSPPSAPDLTAGGGGKSRFRRNNRPNLVFLSKPVRFIGGSRVARFTLNLSPWKVCGSLTSIHKSRCQNSKTNVLVSLFFIRFWIFGFICFYIVDVYEFKSVFQLHGIRIRQLVGILFVSLRHPEVPCFWGFAKTLAKTQYIVTVYDLGRGTELIDYIFFYIREKYVNITLIFQFYNKCIGYNNDSYYEWIRKLQISKSA